MPAEVDPTPALPGLSPVCGKPIIARFDGGKLSSDGSVPALPEITTCLGLTNRLAASIRDPRAPHQRKGLSLPPSPLAWPPAMAVAIAAPPSPSTAQGEKLVMTGKIKSPTSMRIALRA